MRRLLVPLTLLVLATRGVTAAAPDTSAEDLDAVVRRFGLGSFWGAVLVTRGDDALLAKGYGLARADLTPIDADSLFDIGSISKPFTATTILALEADGVLSIDDPVTKHFDDLPDWATDVTLRHLLSHTAGLSDRHAMQRLDFPDRDEAVRRVFAAGRDFAPGTRFAYSNAGYVVLAAVIEKATGRKFETVVRERVLVPAGMDGTGFLDGEGIDLSRGTTRAVTLGPGGATQRRGILQDGWGWGLRGAGGILTSLDDLARWERALAAGKILAPEVRERQFQVEQGGYALGWYVARTGRGGRKIHHGGSTRGYRAHLAWYPEEDTLVAVLTNTAWDPRALERAIAAELWTEERTTIEAVMMLDGLALNQHGVALIDEGVTWRVEAVRDGVALVLATPGGNAAGIAMSRGAANRLAVSIEGVVGGRPRDDGRGTSVLLGTQPYTANDDGNIRLPGSVHWQVMPRYTGMGEDGKAIVDERTTLVLVDAENSFWPIIIKTEPAEAKRIAEALAK